MNVEIWSILYETSKVNREAGTVEMSTADFEALQTHIEDLWVDIFTYWKMLDGKASLMDWTDAGFSESDYDAMRKALASA